MSKRTEEMPLYLSLLGIPIRVETDDRRWRDALHEFWEPFVADPDPSTLTLSIRRSGSGWTYDLESWGSGSNDDPWWFVDDIRQALSELVRARVTHIVDLHAGAIQKESVGLLLVGTSSTGKTTLAMEFGFRGWTFFSDDLAPLADSGRILPFAKPLMIRDVNDWLKLYGRWKSPAWMGTPQHGFNLPANVFSLGHAEGMEVTNVALLDFARFEAATLTEITPAQAVMQCGAHVNGMDAGIFGRLVELLRSARACRLRYGNSGAATDLLEEWACGQLPGRYY